MRMFQNKASYILYRTDGETVEMFYPQDRRWTTYSALAPRVLINNSMFVEITQ